MGENTPELPRAMADDCSNNRHRIIAGMDLEAENQAQHSHQSGAGNSISLTKESPNASKIQDSTATIVVSMNYKP